MRRILFTLTAAVSAALCVAVGVLWARGDGSLHVIAKYDFTTRAASVQWTQSKLYFASEVIGPARFVYPTAGPAGDFAGFGYTTSASTHDAAAEPV